MLLGEEAQDFVCCLGSKCVLIYANNTGYDCNGTKYVDEHDEQVGKCLTAGETNQNFFRFSVTPSTCQTTLGKVVLHLSRRRL